MSHRKLTLAGQIVNSTAFYAQKVPTFYEDDRQVRITMCNQILARYEEHVKFVNGTLVMDELTAKNMGLRVNENKTIYGDQR